MVEWIADNQALVDAVGQWQSKIALDTEFIRTNTYYPMPGLYQVATSDRVYLIDPTTIDAWQPFTSYLTDSDNTIIMHACLEDLELLHHHLNITLDNVFDTQYANAFVSTDFSLSYGALVERFIGVALDKHETRSNWLQRPLTEKQITYAVEDVSYLFEIYAKLVAGLERTQRESWFAHDMRLRSVYSVNDPLEHYRNLKKAWHLQGPELAVLRTLCAWREDTARSENVPRNRIVWDDHLYEFAQQHHLTSEHIFRSLPKGVAKRYADKLLAEHAIGRAAEVPSSLPRPLSSAQGAIVKKLRDVARAQASELDFAPELLARKRDLEACVRHYKNNAELSPHYQGWRGELVAEPFLGVLNSPASEVTDGD